MNVEAPAPLIIVELELFVDQFDPPSVVYSNFTYAVDPEVFKIVTVDVAAPPEQLFEGVFWLTETVTA